MRFAGISQRRGGHQASAALRIVLAVLWSSGLYVAGICLAPVATPMLLLVPLPGLILAVDTLMAGVYWLLLTAGVVGLVLGTGAVAGWGLLFGVPACALALGCRRGWSFEGTALAGIAAWLTGLLGATLFAYGDFASGIGTVRDQLGHGVDLALSTYRAAGMLDGAVGSVQADRDVLVAGVLEILPALMVLSGGLVAIANLVLLRRWARGAHDIDLRLWRTPDRLIWALIAAGFAMFLPFYPASLAARNVFIVLLGCYFCQGLAIVSYFLQRFRLPYGVRVASYLLIAVQHIVAGLVLAVGVFDLWGDFRRLSVSAADLQIPGDGE